MSKKLFDFCIGNPPYQDETIGDNKTYAPPVYNEFLNAAYEIADKTEMIHPARFLFNAGSTPKAWNQQMLNDPHLKILQYSEHSADVFPNTDIKGGVAISYHDDSKDFGAIEIFTPYPALNSILHKVIDRKDFIGLDTIIVTSYAYHFEPCLYDDYPQAKGSLSNGHEYDFKSNVFEKMPEVFFLTKPDDGKRYIRVLGRLNNDRAYRYISAKYVNEVSNLHAFKAFMPGATGTGEFGQAITVPIVGYPDDAATETFMSMGNFETASEAKALIKYVKAKFTRAMYGILKRTQANTPGKWKYVPLQDFSSDSDIDWSQSVHGIDLQLYRKYNLTSDEINFIETHVKEMA